MNYKRHEPKRKKRIITASGDLLFMKRM